MWAKFWIVMWVINIAAVTGFHWWLERNDPGEFRPVIYNGQWILHGLSTDDHNRIGRAIVEQHPELGLTWNDIEDEQ